MPDLFAVISQSTAVLFCHPAGLENFEVYITHNGDFDFWRLMGQDRTHGEMASFLQAVLGSSPPIKCDSVHVAGMIELLRMQGMWLASLRLAYYDTAAVSYDDVLAANASGSVCGAAESVPTSNSGGPLPHADLYMDLEAGTCHQGKHHGSVRGVRRSASRAELQICIQEGVWSQHKLKGHVIDMHINYWHHHWL